MGERPHGRLAYCQQYMKLPRYPIYIPSKGRAKQCLTARFLSTDKVPFKLVVEEQEARDYAAEFGNERLLILPFNNRGSSIPARNWIKEHSIIEGHARHWQLDDNIARIRRLYRHQRIPCASGVALAAVEDFADRYENIAIAGMNYAMFAPRTCIRLEPFFLNCHVYSCVLIDNQHPFKWRGRYNEDTDLCLQVLAAGLCTIATNAFLIEKKPTMTMKGGNTAELYKADGRLKMARSLERLWPGVVTTQRRFQRPQHVIKNAWKGFDTQLKLKEGVKPTKPNEYGMKLVVD